MQFKNPFKNAKLYRYPYGDVVQLFGESPALYSRITDLGLKAHNGWDIYQPYGTPLLAVCNGTIADIKDDVLGYGSHVRLISDWEGDVCYEITYGHLSGIKPFLKVGDKVNCGDEIAYCGNSGFVVSQGVEYWGGSNPDKKGTHLHFGIREFSKNHTGYFVIYPFSNFNIKNYENGFRGGVDPMPFFRDEIDIQARSVIELAKRVISEFIRYFKL
jgi:murein DD-endopeptidase MepM/ murein hydrolase activator NlpD